MNPSWKYYLIDKDTGLYLTITSGGVVSVPDPTPLARTPDGWQEIAIAWERDWQKFGVVRNFSVPLGFVMDGAAILRNELYTTNIERQISLLIERHKLDLTSTTFQHQYNFFYEGQLDFTKFKDNGLKFNVPISEGGIAKKLSAGWNTVQELSMDETIAWLKVDGMYLFQTGNFFIVDGLEMKKSMPTVNANWYLPIAFVNSDGDAPGVAFFSQELQTTATMPFSASVASSNFLAYSSKSNTATINFTIKGTLRFKCTDNDIGTGFRIRFLTSSSTTANQNLYTVFAAAIVAGTSYTVPVNITVPLAPDESMYFQGLWTGGSGLDVGVEFLPDSKLSLEYKNKNATTYIKVKKSSEVAKGITEKLTGSAGDIDTTFIEAHDFIMLSPGDSVRGINTGVKLKTTFTNFFEFQKVLNRAGLEIVNNQIVFDDYENYFLTTSPINIPAVKNLEVSDFAEMRYSDFEVGYPEQQIDGVNGKYETNNIFQFSSPFKPEAPKKFSLVCPYPSQPYMIEKLRMNYEGKTTTDNSSDNTIFIFNTEPDFISFSAPVLIDTDVNGGYFAITDSLHQSDFRVGMKVTVTGTTSNNAVFTVKEVIGGAGGYQVYVDETVITDSSGSAGFSLELYKLKRDIYDNALTDIGIPDPTSIYNIEYFSPKEILLRHIKLINSMLYGFAGGLLKFQSTPRNPNLKRVRGSSVIDEDADETIGTAILFQPFVLDLDAEEPINLVEELDIDINRPVSFGNGCLGFSWRMGIQPDTKSEQGYKLIAGPATDILNIHRDAYK